MSALPDTSPDLVTAARRELMKSSALTNLLVTDADSGSTWLWQWSAKETVRGTGKASMVLSAHNGWAGANRHNTLAFPRLQVEVFADVEREAGLPDARTAAAYAVDVWKAAHVVLHRPDAGGFFWGDSNGTLRIVSSAWADGWPDISEVPDGDGVFRLLTNYAIELG